MTKIDPVRFVVGIDASLTSTGVVALDLSRWRPSNPKRSVIAMRTFGHSLAKDAGEEQRTRRMADVAHGIRELVDRLGASANERSTWIEGHAFGAAKFNGNFLAELHGAIKVVLKVSLVFPRVVQVTSARKLFLGFGSPPRGMPRGWIKGEVLQRVRSLPGLREVSDDEADAFVVANYGVADLGLPACTFAE